MWALLEEFKEFLITAVISGITAAFAYFMGKRKSTAETEVVETDVVRNIRELYGNLVSDLKDMVLELRENKKQLAALTLETDELRKTSRESELNVKGLSAEVDVLRKTSRSLEVELENCRKIFKNNNNHE